MQSSAGAHRKERTLQLNSGKARPNQSLVADLPTGKLRFTDRCSSFAAADSP